VFSVLQNTLNTVVTLEKPTWFGKKKKKIFWGRILTFLGILPKNGFFRLFSAKIGPYATSSIYSESAQKTLPKNIHFSDFRIIRRNFGGKVGCLRHSIYSEKKGTGDY
jgi:hypothetical protein